MKNMYQINNASTLKLIFMLLFLIGGLSLTACDVGDDEGIFEFDEGDDDDDDLDDDDDEDDEDDEDLRLFGNTAVSLHDNHPSAFSLQLSNSKTNLLFMSDQARIIHYN